MVAHSPMLIKINLQRHFNNKIINSNSNKQCKLQGHYQMDLTNFQAVTLQMYLKLIRGQFLEHLEGLKTGRKLTLCAERMKLINF